MVGGRETRESKRTQPNGRECGLWAERIDGDAGKVAVARGAFNGSVGKGQGLERRREMSKDTVSQMGKSGAERGGKKRREGERLRGREGGNIH